jgi:hypothetical protein
MKKNQNKNVEPLEENIDSYTEEKTTLIVETEPDDITEKDDETLAVKAKNFAKKVFNIEPNEEQAAEKKETRGRKKKFKFEKQVTAVTGIVATLIATQFDDDFKLCAPKEEHLNAILTPLGRIADRHMPDVDVNPDVKDAWMAIWSLGVYAIYFRTSYIMCKDMKNIREEHEREITPHFRNLQTNYPTEDINVSPSNG